MKRALLFTAFALAFIVAKSQENFEPGYIVKHNGDSISGLIRVYDWDFNPTSITFKDSNSGEVKNYTTADLKRFKAGKFYFITETVETETTNSKINKISEGAELNFETRTVFLQCIYLGNKSLYYYADQEGVYNLFIKVDNKIELLIYKRYLRTNGLAVSNPNGKNSAPGLATEYAVHNKKFAGQLMVYFNNDDLLTPLIKKANYDLNEIAAIFDKYYSIEMFQNFEFKKDPSKKAKINIGVFGGYSNYQLSFESSVSFEYLTGANFQSSSYYPAGLIVEIVIPYFKNHISISNEFSYLRNATSGNYLDFVNEDRYSEYLSTIDELQITSSHLLKYRIPAGKMNLYANAGVRFGYRAKFENTVTETTKLYTTEGTKVYPIFDEYTKVELSSLLGIGIEFKNIGIEYRLINGNGMSRYSSLISSTKSNSIQLYYLF